MQTRKLYAHPLVRQNFPGFWVCFCFALFSPLREIRFTFVSLMIAYLLEDLHFLLLHVFFVSE